AIFANNSSLTLTNIAMNANKSSSIGGAIYFQGTTSAMGGGLNVQTLNSHGTSSVEGNTAAQVGGAIYQSGTLYLDGATFSNNRAGMEGGAVTAAWVVGSYVNTNVTNTTFLNNHAGDRGGAMSAATNSVFFNNVRFEGNTSDRDGAGFYSAALSSVLNNVTFERNVAAGDGGALFNIWTVDPEPGQSVMTVNGNSSFTNNQAARGGAIYNTATLNIDTTAGNIIFSGNRATGAQGGADIFSQDWSTYVTPGTNATPYANIKPVINLTGNANALSMDGGFGGQGIINKTGANTLNLGGDSSFFTGVLNHDAGTTNMTGRFFGGVSNVTGGIVNFNDGSSLANTGSVALGAAGVMNINHTGANQFAVNGQITGGGALNKAGAGNLVLSGDNSGFTGQFYQSAGATTVNTDRFFGGANTIRNSALNLRQTQSVMTLSSLHLSNAAIDTRNGAIARYVINTFSAAGNNNFSIDINAANRTADQFNIVAVTTAPQVRELGTINISSFNITNDAPTAQTMDLNIFTGAVADYNFTTSVTQVVSPLYVYRAQSLDPAVLGYQDPSGNGKGTYRLFLASNGGGEQPPQPPQPPGPPVPILTDINPQALRGQVTTLATFNNQTFVNMTLLEHIYVDSDKFLTPEEPVLYASAARPVALYQTPENERALWIKPYAAFETLFMTHEANIANDLYGTIVGMDFKPKKLKDAWDFIPTLYAAYNGAGQSFSNTTARQDGAQLGFMGTLLKDNFISSLLLYGGGYYNTMSLNGFTDNTFNWFTGGALKAAYNYRPSENLIIQPGAFISYNYFTKQNFYSEYGTAAMVSSSLNGLNIIPGVNFIYGAKNSNFYVITQYNWNLNDQINGSLDAVGLPNIQMSRGFFEYGLGATKTINDAWITHLQATLRTGSRRGVALQAGFEYKF
ncbi:MAG: hypothetical protein LBR90_05035, partial [Elusimicrobiota bacterium]|nr:hypothetical protein [Elusimicrobiota bacterium]